MPREKQMEENKIPMEKQEGLIEELVKELVYEVGMDNLLIATMLFFGAGGLASGLYLKLFKNN